MQLSVVILNYKVPFYLLQCIQSVQKAIQDIDAEIIVVDNNSRDQSCKWVKKHFPEVSLIQNKENIGFSKANNQGVSLARGKYICLLNPDTVVSETVFVNLLDFAEKHADFGAVGPKLIDGTGNFLPESKRNLPTPQVALQKLINLKEKYYSDLGEGESGKVDVLVGAFMLMKKDRYLEVGGLDEDYFMYGEDIDLSYKFLKVGYQNYYIGSEIVLHYKGESTPKDAEYRKRFYGAMKIFYQKHFQKTGIVNPAIDMALNMAKFFHQIRRKKKKAAVSYKHNYWIANSEKIPEALAQVLSGKTSVLSAKAIKSEEIQKSQLIFDSETMSYQEIFSIMEELKNKQNCFRFKPLNFNFIVGSDHSTGRGEVIEL